MPRRNRKKTNTKKGTYNARMGRGSKHASVVGPAVHEKSIGAIRQSHGLPYEPAPPRGFRPSDAGKEVFDPDNRTVGPLDANDFNPGP